MIDWMTLRVPLNGLPDVIEQRFRASLGMVHCSDSNGEILWRKPFLDLDALRSDTVGLCWMVTRDSEREYLSIGASPASIEHGNNVFGSSDIRHCAGVVVGAAQRALDCILPGADAWSCRRLDITENYLMESFREVKALLRELMRTDSGRHKGSSGAGDTVLWNAGSDLRKGKAYHKGPQLVYLRKRSKVTVEDWQVNIADRICRMELTLGSRWFRRLYDAGLSWLDLDDKRLSDEFIGYFGNMWGGKAEVADMGRMLEELEKVAPSKGQALAAHRTWALIKSIGYQGARDSMPRATWFRHLKFLRASGLSDADLCAGNVLPFVRRTVSDAFIVRSWEEARRAA